MNFTEESLGGATVAINKLRKAWRTLTSGASVDFETHTEHDGIVTRIEEALADDMNTAAALAVVFETANRAEEYVQRGEALDAARALGYALTLLGLAPDERWLTEPSSRLTSTPKPNVCARVWNRSSDSTARVASEIIARAIAARDEARRKKDFALADQIRDALIAERIELRDTREGTTTWTLAGE